MTGRTGKSSNRAALISGLVIILLLGAVRAAAQYDIYDLGYTVRTHDIQADNANNVHIVWTDRAVLYYGKIVNNAISGRVEVASGIETSMWRPYVSVQPDGGSVHVAWTTAGFGNMLMHSWKTTGGWTTEHVLTVPGTQKLSQATCAIDSSGILHVMFVIWNNVSTNDWATVFYMRKLASGKWESEQQFIPYDIEYKHPFLIVDSGGRVHATWTLQGRFGTDVYEAYYCTAPSGGKLSYTDMVKLPKKADCDVNGYGELYVDHNGVVHRSIGGWSNAKQKMCLDHTKKPVGGSFETPTRASIGFLNVWTDPIPVVVANEDGVVIVAWVEIGSNGSNTVKASFYDPGERTWSLYTVDPAAGIPTVHYGYRVALTRTDKQLYGVWRGSNGHIKLLVSGLDGTPPPDAPPPPPPGENPVASFTATPTSGPSPLTVTFDGSASYDSDGSIVSYKWSFGEEEASGAIVSHTYTTSGTFRAHLTVTDNDGNTDSASEVIQVSKPNQPPVADFNFSPSTGISPCEIAFDGGTSRDPDGTIVQYSWNFGDGGRASGRAARHTYTRWGTFTVSLTVRDNTGSSAHKVRNIEIQRLFQPLNIRWETHQDESLFQTRSVNEVIWERNPANDSLGVQIILHRIWRKKTGESDLAFKLIGELTSDVYSYTDKDAGSDNTYIYTVTVRDNQGHESPIVGSGGNSSLIQSSQDFQPVLKRNKLRHR
ncbi:MAG: PKD domain-containing protein [Candidatus Aminicenantales bacterium]